METKTQPVHRTDFEKLVIARAYIESLQFYIGELESERDELKDMVQKMLSSSNGEKKEFKKDKHVAELLITIQNQASKKNELERKVSQMKKDYDYLLTKLHAKQTQNG